MKLLAFDLETAKVTPPDADPQDCRPLGICCWAIASQDEDGSIRTNTGHSGLIHPPMSREECQWLVDRLIFMVDNRGYTLLTHNGVGFDLDILAEESGYHVKCQSLAVRSVDTCLLVHCIKGFPVGLDAVAKGLGLAGKLEGVSGAKAPELWQQGEYDTVLQYVAQDVRSTLEVALEIERQKAVRWISKAGRRNGFGVRRLLTVQECLALPLPDTSWMSDPMPRSRFTGWMERGQ